MKNLIAFALLSFLIASVSAQETFFPTTKGVVLTYKTFDKKGKETGGMKYTIKNVQREGTNINITYMVESSDQKENIAFSEEITIQQREDKLYMDMSNFLNKGAFQQNGEIPVDIEVTGNNLELPVNANPGDVLPDANVEMAMKMGFINMKMAAQVTNRKLESIEDITVKAGPFNTYRFSSKVNATTMGLKVETNNMEWYAKGIGILKSESYDKKGKLQSTTELVEIIK